MRQLNNSTGVNSSVAAASGRLTEDLTERFLADYILVLIIVVGTVGNVTSLAVLLRQRMRRTSVYFYLTVLALADLSVLYVSAFKTWVRRMTGFELMHVSSMTCSLITFLIVVVLNLAAWLIVLTTVDRFVAVWLPLHATTFCRRRRARLAVLVLLGLITAANFHLFWTTGLYSNQGRMYCGPTPQNHFMHYQFEFIKLASYSVVPFVIILTLNISIVVRLRCRLTYGKTAGDILHDSGGNVAQQGAMTSKVTYMLLAVSVAWLLLTAPWTLHTFVGSSLLNVERWDAFARYLRIVGFLLMYANHAINFFLYCVTGRKFRHELRDMFKELCCRGHSANDCRSCCARCRHGNRGFGARYTRTVRSGVADLPTPTSRHGRIDIELPMMTSCQPAGHSTVAQPGCCVEASL